MKMRWVALIALGSLTIGMGTASWYWLNFYSQFINSGLTTSLGADIVTKVSILERIRAGKITEATTLLETLLDIDLISAASLAREGATFSPNTARALAREAKARSLSGYRSIRDDMHNAVQEAFCLVSAATEAKPPVDIPAGCTTDKVAPSP